LKLIIAGDLVPTESNYIYFEKGEISTLIGTELLKIWNDSDIRVFNLETPITDIIKPIKKCGPNLVAPAKTAKGIKALNPSLITLANNHIFDQGAKGLQSTCEVLTKMEIPFVGVGENLPQAKKPFVLEKAGKRIGFYVCTEHEFSIATSTSPGANPFDPFESLEHIANLKNNCDFVIVLYHGGKELYPYPSPYLQMVCRKMVEKGAQLVITQHSHCIGCYEHYRESTIVYGQGNFIFDYSNEEPWKTSILVEVEFTDSPRIKYIPIVKEDERIKLAESAKGNKILAEFRKRSREILSPGYVEEKFIEFAKKNINLYLQVLYARPRWLSFLDRRVLGSFLISKKYNEKKILSIKNYIECEAHREVLIRGLESKYD